jgi:ABC-type multidrug transport system ATPase subunit
VRDAAQVQQIVGCCPQEDALLELLSGRQHLLMYAAFRGITKNTIPAVLDRLIDQLDLRHWIGMMKQAFCDMCLHYQIIRLTPTPEAPV